MENAALSPGLAGRAAGVDAGALDAEVLDPVPRFFRTGLRDAYRVENRRLAPLTR